MIRSYDTKDEELIKLKLGGNWTLVEFETLLSNIRQLYCLFYAINDLQNTIDDYLSSIEEYRHKSPYWDEYYYTLRKILKTHPKDFPPLLHPLLPQKVSYENISDAIISGDWYIKPNHEIKIKKIKMSSPGEIHIEAASTLREVREFIKDISYRNNHEKEMGELKIIEKKIEILTAIGVPKQEIGKIIMHMKKNGTSIEDMLNKEKIGLIIDKEA